MVSLDHKEFYMMTSSNENIFRVTGPLCGEFASHRWIPLAKASNAELWCFFLICAWINGCVNSREPGDLRRHRAHYDGIVMKVVFLHAGGHWGPLWVLQLPTDPDHPTARPGRSRAAIRNMPWGKLSRICQQVLDDRRDNSVYVNGWPLRDGVTL